MNKIDTICIIDDDPIYIFGVKRMIEMANLCDTFLIYKNGKEALENLKPLLLENKTLPLAILLDLNMPIMDGWQFLDEYVKIKPEKDITFFIVSSSIDPKDRERVNDYSFVSSYIIKPISHETIAQIGRDIFN